MVEPQPTRTGFAATVGVAFTLGYDEAIWNHDSLIKIALTQFETNRFPSFQVDYINKCDHLIVTSSFQLPVAKDSGVKIPVSVMTPGIDTETFTERPARDDGQFRVLILGGLTGRKNPQGAIRIFQQASQADPTWLLTIKNRAADGINEVRKKGEGRVGGVAGASHPLQGLN